MNPDQFSADCPGQVVSVTGLPGITHAFVPEPLPARWTWPVHRWPLLLEARTALAALDGTGRHLPNPELVLRPLQNREAQRSSSLEGTVTDPRRQALFQLDPKLPDSSGDPDNALREVFNYGQALRFARDDRERLPLSLRLIRTLHRVLLDGVRGSDRKPGEFRTTHNQIGRPARFVPPPPQYLPDLLDNLERYLHAERQLDPLVDAFVVHYQFEAIHPFMDGNGRVGRLLLSILIAEWCGLANQWLYMSAFYDRNKDEYIDRLFRVSSCGDWEGWIEFCLRGVVEQARDTEQRCDRLLALNRDFHERLRHGRGSVRLSAIVDGLFVSPVAIVTRVAQAHNVTYPTARSDLAKLERLGILRRVEGVERISYYCPEILDITYAD